MFQYGDNEINSYNSLTKNQIKKAEIGPSKIFSSSKILIANDNISKYKNNQINSNKTVILDINNSNNNTLDLEKNNNEKKLNCDKDINLEENDSNNKTNSSKNLEKLPKIIKYSIQTNSILESSSNINPILSVANSIDKTINRDNNFYRKHQLFFNEQLKSKNSKKRKNSLRLSGTGNFESIKQKNKDSQSAKFDNNISKKIQANNEPKLGKMKEYIKLPDFIGDEPLTEMIFHPVLQDNLIKPQNEKQYEISLYLNSHKMLNNLIYSKIPLSKEGIINIQNIINVKKLNKENKFEEDEEVIQENKKENNEKENEKQHSPEEEIAHILLPKNKPYVSISEYPGNYKPQNNKNERDLNLSQNFMIKINNKNEVKSTRGPLNLNLYEICKRYQNNSEIYGEKNSEKYNSKSIFIPNGNDFYENKTDKNENCNNNTNDNIIIEDSEKDNNQEIQLNTIYGDIKPYYTLKNENDKTLIFESRFESGNLLCAFKTEEENNYQLYLQNDTNTTGYIQWFFFRVTNTKKGKKANFTIINMLRTRCIYKKGLKIMTYSKKQALNENIGWHRDCENIMYFTNNLFTYNENSKKKRSLNSLYFEYEFKYDNDTVYFANCLPYFYSKLTKEINFYENKIKQKNFFLEKNAITQTLGGNDLFLLNIKSNKTQNNINSEISLPHLNQSCYQPFSNMLNSSFYLKKNEFENQQNSKKGKKVVIMIARQHPGETVGSHVIKGVIDFLLGDFEEAQKLREIYDFYIFPMMNPDGVLVGNSRTSFAGCDLNRRWSKPNEIIHPEIFKTKSLILKTALNQNISFIIDFHGHFGTYNSLFYCNQKENKKICSLFPYLCSKLSNIISFKQSTFSMPKYKNSTERLSLFRELEYEDNNNIVALETSFFGTKKDLNEKNYYFNSKLLNEIGRDVCMGMLSYYMKYENITLENNVNFLSDIEKIKLLDVDMRDFESELIKEVNEEEGQETEEELSESEPSIDNFDKKEIMRLMPVYQKKKKKKGKNINFNYNSNKIKKLDKYLIKKKIGAEKNNNERNKNIDIDIELYNPLKELTTKKLDEENKKKLKLNKNPPVKSSSITSNDFKKTKNIQFIKNNQKQLNPSIQVSTEPNFKSDYTQTEEIFFRMHWTFFVGKFKILTGKRNTNNNNLPNISTIPINIGKFNNNYIDSFSHSTYKRNDLLINRKLKNTNWVKFGNIFVDEKNINQIRKRSENNNIKIIKSNGAEKNKNKNFLIKESSNIRAIYLTRFNGNNLSVHKRKNDKNIINKEWVKEQILNDKNNINKKLSSDRKRKEDNNIENNDNNHA